MLVHERSQPTVLGVGHEGAASREGESRGAHWVEGPTESRFGLTAGAPQAPVKRGGHPFHDKENLEKWLLKS